MEYCTNKMALGVTSKSLFVKHGGGGESISLSEVAWGIFSMHLTPSVKGRIIIILKVDTFFLQKVAYKGDKGLDLRLEVLPCTSLLSTLLLR